jgi:hypothetical protein
MVSNNNRPGGGAATASSSSSSSSLLPKPYFSILKTKLLPELKSDSNQNLESKKRFKPNLHSNQQRKLFHLLSYNHPPCKPLKIFKRFK